MTSVPHPEPIAIVGMGCRFPGESSSPSKFWDLLHDPRDVSQEIPGDRFNSQRFYHPDGKHHGTTNVRRSYFLSEDIRHFDTQFFGIAPAEAEAMDPQHRLLLEVVYEALESSGTSIAKLTNSDTAVYVGLMCSDYYVLQAHDMNTIPTYNATGVANSNASSRISYFFDWHGPSMTIDTACSSSLVALHEAVQTLRSKRSRVAFAAGTNLLLSPLPYVSESKLNMLSPTGRSRMWDADADGYARGEGVAAVMLKSLSAAIQDGDRIEGVIRETGVNQDGRTKGITMPSAVAQAALIRDTYARAGLDPTKPQDRCQYFEAHGTGTPAGDPQEAEALNQAFFSGAERVESDNPQSAMLVGSVKTVIGHTEGTAGLAGLIKVCLALKHGVVPPNMLFSRLNPALEPFVANLRIPTRPQAWPALPDTHPRRASVNSFGFGGTNAHAILENYEEIRPKCLDRAPTTHDQPAVSIIPHVFSAASKGSLLALLRSYLSYLERNAEVDLKNLAHTLITKRSSLGVRVALAATTQDQLREGISSVLQQVAEGNDSSLGSYSSARKPSILGVFTGQGAQWAAMGKQLINRVPRAMALVERLDRSLGALPEEYMPRWSLVRELLVDGSSRVQQAEISQPLCTAVQVLLVDLLSAAGIRFSAVVGHSSGEIAAAYAAGFISADDAIRIAYLRGHFAKSACGPNGENGRMMAVGTSIADAKDLCDLDDFRGRICIAAHNSPDSVTLSGDEEAIHHAKKVFDEEGKFTRILKVDTAYHSHHLSSVKEAYLAALQDQQIQIYAPNADAPQWYSSVHAGHVVNIHDKLEGEYWVENMRNTVQFATAVEKCVEGYSQKSLDYIVEVGPHPALMGPVRETIRQTTGKDVPYTGTLRRGMDDIIAYQTILASLWTAFGDHAVDLAGLEQESYQPDSFQNLEDLPQYAWSHDRLLWAESRSTKLFRTLPGGFHDLLGVRTEDSTENEWRWRNVLKTQELPWLSCHALQGQTVFPGTGYIALAMEAALQVAQDRQVQLIELRDLKIRKAISINDHLGTDLVVTLTNISRAPEGEDDVIEARYNTFSSSNKDSASMTLNTSGDVRIILGSPQTDLFPPRTPPKAPLSALDIDRFYSAMRNDLGYMYDGPFRGLTKLERRLGHSSGAITNPCTGPDETQLLFHPGMLDNALQGLFAAYSAPGDGRLWSMRASTACRRITLNPSRCGPHMTSEVAFDCTVTDPRDDFITGDVDVYSADFDSKIIEFEGLSFSPFAAASEQNDRCLFQQCVEYVDQPDGGLVLGDRQPSAPERQKALDAERVAFYYLKSLHQAVDLDLRLDLPWYRQSLLDNASRVVGLVRDGAHPYAPQSWLNDSEDDIQAIIRGYGEQDPDFNLTRAVGENLPRPSVLTGETNILEYMTQNNYLDNYYTHAIGFDWLNELISGTILQLTCKFPHMKICEIGAGTGGATQAILEKVGDAFASYTYTDISSGFFEKAQSRFQRFSSRLNYKVLDIERDPTTQGFEEHSYDLVLAANVLHATACLEHTLHNVRKLLRPGGFLVLMEIVGNDVFRIGLVMGGLPGWWVGKDDGRRYAPTVTLEQWDSLFRATEFSGIETYTPMPDKVQMPGSVFVTQAVDATLSKLREPQHFPPTSAASSDLVILGGSSDSTSRLVQVLVPLLEPFFKHVITIRDLKHLPTIPPRAFALSLLDCDGLLFEKLDEPLWQSFKTLVLSLSGLLWVTTGSRLERPYAGIALGLLRSLVYEIPETKIQCLDVDDVSDEGTSAVIARLLLQMQFHSAMPKEKQEAILWTPEPELILAKNRLHMVRVQPQAEQNDRYNSFRRPIMRETTLGTNDLRLEYDGGAYVLREKHDAPEPHKDYRTVQVEYSLLSAIKANDGYYFLCLGICQDTCQKVLCLSTDNSSIVTVPQSMLVTVDNNDLIDAQFMSFVVADLVRQHILRLRPAAGTLLIHEPDPGLASLLSGRTVGEGQSIVFTTCKPSNAKRRNWIYVHERTPARTIDALIPRDVALIIDLSSTAASKYGLGTRIASLRPQADPKLGFSNLVHSTASPMPTPVPESIGLLLERVSEFAQSQLNGVPDGAPLDTLTVGEAVTKQLPESSLALIQWDPNQSVSVLVEPITVRDDLFQGDRTYWLAGLAGDMGQSLADFMIQRGARHIALSSRNPIVCPEWQKLCQARGAHIEYFTCDLTQYASVQSTLSAIESKMPRIAGVANGALVLRDTPVATMSFDDLQTVLKPKVDGTVNLDSAFAHHALDWFIAFSSIVGTTGNMGQAAYSAANCFMKALVNNRRRRGLAGSVIDISRVIGVGYVERETKSEGRLTKEQTERLMNRTGTIPMSEPDLHQLFAEAVVAGLPGTAPGSELITGLAPIGMAQAETAFWAANPKFGLLVRDQTTSSTVSTLGENGRSIAQVPVWIQLQDATSPQEVSTLIQVALGSKLRASLFLSATDPLSPETPLVDLGIDSLVAVEVRTWAAKELSVDLPVLKILGGASILDLVTDILGKLPGDLLANTTATVSDASGPNFPEWGGRESPLADSSLSASYDLVSMQSPPTTVQDSDCSDHDGLKSSG
ncbi:type I Iterative Polyketide synthase (PKS) [Aspergillus niger]|nr:type I Iterative Polyketide synthase (PKS) [Aspergillus niger]